MPDRSLIDKKDFHLRGQLGRKGANVIVALQHAIVNKFETYRYLEIGSFKGKSLLPHVLSAACTKCVSIDLRPALAPDVRGIDLQYDHITAEKMVASIAEHVPEKSLEKLTTFTANSSVISSELQDQRFDMVFIDGEHTIDGVMFDVENVKPVLAHNSVVIFDDNSLIYPVLEAASYLLRAQGGGEVLYFKGGISAIFLGDKLKVEDVEVPDHLWSSKKTIAQMHAEVLPT